MTVGSPDQWVEVRGEVGYRVSILQAGRRGPGTRPEVRAAAYSRPLALDSPASHHRCPEPPTLSHQIDPTYRNARREAWIILAVWAASTIYCCAYSYFFGYQRAGQTLGVEDIRPILGMPSWVVWGVMAPWAACTVFTVWFAGFYMQDDDLGVDHTDELERDIREEGAHHG